MIIKGTISVEELRKSPYLWELRRRYFIGEDDKLKTPIDWLVSSREPAHGVKTWLVVESPSPVDEAWLIGVWHDRRAAARRVR